MDKVWLQVLLAGVPVLLFVGAWMTLRHVARHPHAAPAQAPGDKQGRNNERSDQAME